MSSVVPTNQLETLDAALRRRAAELPDHVVYRYLHDGETESHHLTYAGLDARARALAARLQALGQPGQTVLVLCDAGLEPIDPDWTLNEVSWMPLSHIAGLTYALLVLRVGKATDVLLPAELVLEQPLRWLRAISRYRTLQSGGPNFLYQLCVDQIAPEDRASLDLGLWLFATCTSEPIRAETLEQFAAAYAPAGFQPWAFVPNYGLSEQPGVTGRAGPRMPRIAAFDRAALAQKQVVPVEDDSLGAMRLVSNGPPAPSVTVRIVDPATETVCPPGLVGEVWTASEYAAAGYWNRPQATAATFQALTAGTGEGPFLRTGDLGFIYEEELYICGRIKDIIIIRGQNYYAQDIEAAAAGSHPDLGGAAAAFAVPAAPEGGEQVVITYEVRPECAAPDVPAISAAIRRAVSHELQLPIYAVVVVQAGALPRTNVGKIQRYLVREQFIATQMPAPAPAASPMGEP